MTSVTSLKIVTILAVALVFATDTLTPMGFAHGMLYTPVLILTLFIGSRRWLFWIGAVSFALIPAGVFISRAAEVPPEVYWPNRLISQLLLAVTGILLDNLMGVLIARLTIERLQAAQLALEQDLSDYKELEQNAYHRQRLFSELTASLPIIIWMADDQGQVDFVNQALADYTGVAVEAISLPRGWLDLLHPEDREPTVTVWQQAVKQHQAYTTEFRIRREDGHYGHFLASARPVDRPGEGSRWYGTATDMDEYRLLQEQLHQARRLESIGQLTGGLAHDFNNLLTVVTGNAGLLRDLLSDRPQAQEMADLVVQAAENGARLTETLLAFSRRQTLTPSRIDVISMIHSLEPILRNCVGKTIVFTVSAESSLPPVVLDRAQLESAILNLAINARDAMPGGGTLALRAYRTNEEDVFGPGSPMAKPDWVIIEMADTGYGMDEATQSRVYEPFFTTKQPGQGTGLGLSQVFGFVTQSGGEVQLRSKPDGGTRVRLCFPVADAGVGPPGNPDTEA